MRMKEEGNVASVRAEVTSMLVETVLANRFDDLPVTAIRFAKHCLIDFVAVTLAGCSEPVTEVVLAEVLEQGGHPAASLIGLKPRVAPHQAALVNGTAGHALDYDDTNFTMNGHVTVSAMPALLALAEFTHSSGKQLIAAYVAAADAGCRMGLLVEPGHYLAGFHATATLGTFAATAGCAHLLGLDVGTTQQAFSLAGTQASGLKSMFGTMGKPFHAGRAAQNGLNSVKLAQRGFVGRPDILEVEQGFADTHSPDFKARAALDVPRHGAHVCATLFKYHAACYGVHAAVEAALQIRSMDGFVLAALDRVTVEVGVVNGGVCNIQEPTTSLEARFSIRLMTAFALAGLDTSQLDSFDLDRINSAETITLRDKVEVVLCDDLEITFARMRAEFHGGQVMNAEIALGQPAADLDYQEQRLVAKFKALAVPTLGKRRSEELLALLLQLETLTDVSVLAAAWSI
jgi:2-methylcitrate dehydratase PrpD